MPEKISIDYYSDTLCVWAWIAQPRLEELDSKWGEQIEINHHFVDIFGNSNKKIPARWGETDGYEKFAAHVEHSAAEFERATVNPSIWRDTRPNSSAQSHLLLRAAGTGPDAAQLPMLALAIRKAFFCDAQNISDMEVLFSIAEEQNFDVNHLRKSLQDGSALAALTSDLKQAIDLGVRGSPTWILNSGRQVLYGNVGYRILNANIEELLAHPSDEASWC
ncbi:DsbA family oxidoreductase [Halioglobus maricola]|nr:DsbA family protein [Halioglobus maricola]